MIPLLTRWQIHLFKEMQIPVENIGFLSVSQSGDYPKTRPDTRQDSRGQLGRGRNATRPTPIRRVRDIDSLR